MDNAALALAASRALIGAELNGSSLELSEAEQRGLKFTKWPGRSQICSHDKRTVYLDGAHTVGELRI